MIHYRLKVSDLISCSNLSVQRWTHTSEIPKMSTQLAVLVRIENEKRENMFIFIGKIRRTQFGDHCIFIKPNEYMMYASSQRDQTM